MNEGIHLDLDTWIVPGLWLEGLGKNITLPSIAAIYIIFCLALSVGRSLAGSNTHATRPVWVMASCRAC